MKRVLHLEAVRVIAILCVMYLHTGFKGHEAYSCTDSRITFVVSLILACISPIAVYLFWMVSGALMLSKSEDAKYVYTKRVTRILIVLLIFSVIRYFYDWFMGIYGADVFWGEAYGAHAGMGLVKLGFWDFFSKFIAGRIFLPYWFLYSYIEIMLLLPFIRRAVQGMNIIEWKIFAALEVFLVFVNVCNKLFHAGFAVSVQIPEAVNVFVLGYVAEKIIPSKWLEKGRNLIGLLGLIIMMVAIEYITTITIGNPVGDDKVEFTNMLVVPMAFCIMLLIRGISIKLDHCPQIIVRAILYAGGCTFGLYIIEDYVRQILSFIYDRLAPILTIIPACIIWILCSFLIGIMIAGFMKKIPWLGKYI